MRRGARMGGGVAGGGTLDGEEQPTRIIVWRRSGGAACNLQAQCWRLESHRRAAQWCVAAHALFLHFAFFHAAAAWQSQVAAWSAPPRSCVVVVVPGSAQEPSIHRRRRRKQQPAAAGEASRAAAPNWIHRNVPARAKRRHGRGLQLLCDKTRTTAADDGVYTARTRTTMMMQQQQEDAEGIGLSSRLDGPLLAL